jgi:hypothetical protein
VVECDNSHLRIPERHQPSEIAISHCPTPDVQPKQGGRSLLADCLISFALRFRNGNFDADRRRQEPMSCVAIDLFGDG